MTDSRQRPDGFSAFTVSQQFVYLASSVRWQGILIRETNQVELIDLVLSLVLVISRGYILGQDFLLTRWRGQHSPFFGPARKEENGLMMDICLWNATEISCGPLSPPAILHPLTHASYSRTKTESCHSQLLPQPRPLLTSARHWDSIPNIGQQPDGIMEQSSICDVLTNRLKQMKETEFCRFCLWIKACTFVSYPCPCYSYFKRSAEIPIRNETHKLRSQKSREAELSFKGAVCCLPCLPALS